MKKFLIFNFSFLIFLTMLTSCAKQPAQQQEQESTESQSQGQSQYIDFTAVTPEGEELSLSDLVGKTDYVLVDFWASWCGPCRRLIPVLKEIYAGQPEGRLQIFSCSVDQDVMAWLAALSEEKMPWPQAREDADHVCSGLYGVQYIPYTVLIDKEGNIVSLNPDESEIEAILFAE